MSPPAARVRDAFERFVSLQQDLLALLQKRVELDRGRKPTLRD